MRIKKIDGRKFVELEDEKDEKHLKEICQFYSGSPVVEKEDYPQAMDDFAVTLENELDKK